MVDPLAQTFIEASLASLARSEKQILSCTARLNEAQMQHRGGDHENSIVNLLLHLEGNMRQWILHGVGEQPDVRERDAEFSLETGITGKEAIALFVETLAECRTAVAGVAAERLLEVIDPQPSGSLRYPTVLAAIFKTSEHISHHAGQIILLTKQMAATDLDLSMPRKH